MDSSWVRENKKIQEPNFLKKKLIPLICRITTDNDWTSKNNCDAARIEIER
jgi:hypothetical protein